MFDPNEHLKQCEAYISHSLGYPVNLIQARKLTQSTRQAPWRLDVRVDGHKRSYVLQLDARGMEYEYRILKALESISIPTPRVFGLDLSGEALGSACFFSEFISGESLLHPLLKREDWAETLYFNAVSSLLQITKADLGESADIVKTVTMDNVLEEAYAYFTDNPHPLADAIHERLRMTMPDLPSLCFSNGDLWLENFITQDRILTGIIDFQAAAFSDPIFEFLLSFFVSPELQGRGIEERFCKRLGVDPVILDWYHGVELFATWRWTHFSGKNFVHHSAASLEKEINNWLG